MRVPLQSPSHVASSRDGKVPAVTVAINKTERRSATSRVSRRRTVHSPRAHVPILLLVVRVHACAGSAPADGEGTPHVLVLRGPVSLPRTQHLRQDVPAEADPLLHGDFAGDCAGS